MKGSAGGPPKGGNGETFFLLYTHFCTCCVAEDGKQTIKLAGEVRLGSFSSPWPSSFDSSHLLRAALFRSFLPHHHHGTVVPSEAKILRFFST